MQAKENTPDVYIALGEYYENVRKILDSHELFTKMIGMMAETSSKEKVKDIYNRYTGLKYAHHFIFCNIEWKADEIRRVISLLDYFGFGYPPLPEPINHLMEQKKEENDAQEK